MIYASNLEGRVLDINQAGIELMGYKSREGILDGLNARDFYVDPAGRDRFINAIKRQGFVKDYEAEFKKQDWTRMHVLISSRMYENEESGEVEFVGIIKNITERKQNEETIRQRNRELSLVNGLAVALNHSMDVNHIMDVTLEKVVHVLHLERGGIFIINHQTFPGSYESHFE